MKYASIFRRIFAYLIDCLLVFLVFVTVSQLAFFVPLRHFVIGSEEWFKSGWHTEVYTFLTISLPVWLYFILFESSPWKATLGKRLLKLQTVDSKTGDRISLPQAILRTFIMMLPWELAHFTNNIPTPMWYTSNPGFRLGFAIIPLLVLVYIAVTQFTRRKQSLHDLVAKTVVIYTG